MLLVKLELHPYGDERLGRVLGEIRIANDGKGTEDWANYNVLVTQLGPPGCSEQDRRWKARVKGWHRKQNVWQLVRQALVEALE